MSEATALHERAANGDVDGAAQQAITAKLFDVAADIFEQHDKLERAAGALLAGLSRDKANPTTRARAMRAGGLYERLGQWVRACDVFAWIGATAELKNVAERARSGTPLEAGQCLLRAGDVTAALPLLLKVRRNDPNYARACIEAAGALARGAAMTMEVDMFVADFVRRGPNDDAEAEALYVIAAAFAREGFPENAIEALNKLEAKRPGFRDAAQQAKRLQQAQRGAVQDFARVLEEDARFHGRTEQTSTQTPAGNNEDLAPARTETQIEDPTSRILESFAPGVMLAKRYRIEELIGRGGMSLVYRATDLELKDTVALKIFTQPTNEDALARFKQEVLLARQLLHRNVIRVYDLGTALGARFLTMELLVGEDMHAKMVRGVSLRDGIDMLIQACAGLEVAHQAGVVHRDVKPENLFVTKDNVVKVTDFGIAKQLNSSGLTVAGMVVGTPEYMAPEQAHGHMKITPAADLYSLGVIYYFLCTNTLPFRHAEMVPLLMMHVNQKPEPPRQRNPHLHPDAEALALELLEKDPAKRPPSARALGERFIDLRLRGVV